MAVPAMWPKRLPVMVVPVVSPSRAMALSIPRAATPSRPRPNVLLRTVVPTVSAMR